MFRLPFTCILCSLPVHLKNVKTICYCSKESERTTIVTKRRPQSLLTTVAANESQPIRLTEQQQDWIVALMDEFPIETEDLDREHHRDDEYRRAAKHREHLLSSSNFCSDRPHAKSAPSSSFIVPPLPSRIPDHLQRLREQLPAFAYRKKLLETIGNHRVCLFPSPIVTRGIINCYCR